MDDLDYSFEFGFLGFLDVKKRYRILVPYVISTNCGRNLAGCFRNSSVLMVFSVQINSSVSFLLLDKSNMVNDVLE